MLLHWYACISTNTYCFEMHYISLEMDWWVLSNASLIVWIRLAIHEILADKAFTATDGLISRSFVVALVPPTYVQIALIWGFPAQLSLWKSVHWLWRYKLNEVCDTCIKIIVLYNIWYYLSFYMMLWQWQCDMCDIHVTVVTFCHITMTVVIVIYNIMLFSFTKSKKKNKEKSKWKNKNLNNRKEMEKEQVHCYQV